MPAMQPTTDAEAFTRNEIEVFEIVDQTALPADVKKCANRRFCRGMAQNVGELRFETAISHGSARVAPGGAQLLTSCWSGDKLPQTQSGSDG
jgi:hypothetical protein